MFLRKLQGLNLRNLGKMCTKVRPLTYLKHKILATTLFDLLFFKIIFLFARTKIVFGETTRQSSSRFQNSILTKQLLR